jgi:hypothetical protein
MKIEELCEMIQVELEVKYVPEAAGPWVTSINKPYGRVFYKESKDDCMEMSCCGWGSSPDASIANFVSNLNNGPSFIVQEDEKGGRMIFGIPRLDYP